MGGRQPVDMDRNSATIRLTVAVAAVAALGGLTACSTKPISKAGSTDQHAQTIVLQMPWTGPIPTACTLRKTSRSSRMGP